ncbi:MAG: hypothetical protein A2234_08215 [Elusimicrobia bacterium RIFOXYA2_FULL_58_8]|nr:MAG: hypothetical protein A2285_01350 [Elusimicrobia bacterium RIFOXYA12_FULL_57_11]OGS17060.1 MAG: hypothetical protein A2234_08215 [Elusimicrobia bacterium RIFOXYA2_FULL_58_8]
MNYPFSPAMPASARFVAAELAAWPLAAPPGTAAPIQELHIEVTHRCNLRCRMCHHWRIKPPGHEMTPGELARLLENSKRLRGIKTAVLTGGEPLLRPDLAQLASVILTRFPGISLGILTNLSDTGLILRRIGECVEAGAPGLWLGSSLDGAGAAHDAVRGARGAYARTLKSVKAIRAKYPAMNIAFNFTLLPDNAPGLVKTYLAAKKLNLWLGAQKVVNQAGFEAEKFAWSPKALRAAITQLDWIIADICREHKAFERLVSHKEHETPWLWSSLIYWLRLRDYLARPRRLMGECYAGSRYAMLSPAGELFFCPVRRNRTLGCALEKGFDAVWTGPKAGHERAAIASARCHCWLHCIANTVIARALALRFAPLE